MFHDCIAFIWNSVLSVVHKLGLPLYPKWIFAIFYSRIMRPYFVDPALNEEKTIHFAPLQTLTSRDKHLAKKGGLRLLEIGPGPGTILKYYREGTRLIAVDNNKYFGEYLKKNIEGFPRIKLEEQLCCFAENMAEVPDNSVDVVVSTYVLCSVIDPQAVVKEILRVLVPGGHYFYFEHVGYEPETWGRLLQRLIKPFWMVGGNGCHLTRIISPIIKETGFTTIKEKHMSIRAYPYFVKPHTIGRAVK